MHWKTFPDSSVFRYFRYHGHHSPLLFPTARKTKKSSNSSRLIHDTPLYFQTYLWLEGIQISRPTTHLHYNLHLWNHSVAKQRSAIVALCLDQWMKGIGYAIFSDSVTINLVMTKWNAPQTIHFFNAQPHNQWESIYSDSNGLRQRLNPILSQSTKHCRWYSLRSQHHSVILSGRAERLILGVPSSRHQNRFLRINTDWKNVRSNNDKKGDNDKGLTVQAYGNVIKSYRVQF